MLISTYVLLVAVGLNIVGFGTYDCAEECGQAAVDEVARHSGEVDAMCIDMKNHRITYIVGRGG